MAIDAQILIDQKVEDALWVLENRPFREGEPIQVWLLNDRARITSPKLGQWYVYAHDEFGSGDFLGRKCCRTHNDVLFAVHLIASELR